MKKWLKQIGSRKAMEQRQADRLALKLNKPRKVWGLAKLAKHLRESGTVNVRYRSKRDLFTTK